MKTVLAVNGSPRGKRGNTDKILQPFLDGMRDVGAKVEMFYLKDLAIAECRGCYTCQMITPGECVIKDDMDWLVDEMLKADVMVFATPLYVFTVTALMKAFMDRMIVLGDLKLIYVNGLSAHPPLHADKKWEWVLISNAGFPERAQFTALEETFRKFAWAIGGGTHVKMAGSILKGMGEILTVKQLLPEFQWFFDACRKAGREVIEKGSITQETQAILDRPFLDLPPEELVLMCNHFIEKATKVLKERGSAEK